MLKGLFYVWRFRSLWPVHSHSSGGYRIKKIIARLCEIKNLTRGFRFLCVFSYREPPKPCIFTFRYEHLDQSFFFKASKQFLCSTLQSNISMDPCLALTGFNSCYWTRHFALAILDVISMFMWKSRRQNETTLTNKVCGGERSYTTKHQLAQHSNKIKKKRTISKEGRKLFSKKKCVPTLSFPTQRTKTTNEHDKCKWSFFCFLQSKQDDVNQITHAHLLHVSVDFTLNAISINNVVPCNGKVRCVVNRVSQICFFHSSFS